VYGYNIPALKVNIIIVHPRGVVFPRGKTHIGLDTLALKKLKNKEKRKEITETPSELGNSSSKKKKGNQAKKMKKLEAFCELFLFL
jgi:hypothetical protein